MTPNLLKPSQFLHFALPFVPLSIGIGDGEQGGHVPPPQTKKFWEKVFFGQTCNIGAVDIFGRRKNGHLYFWTVCCFIFHVYVRWPSILDYPGQCFISGSCPGFHGVLDLKSSDPSLENVYLSQYYVLNVRLLTTLPKTSSWTENCTNLISWFSAKSLKLLPPVIRFQDQNAPNSISAGALAQTP